MAEENNLYELRNGRAEIMNSEQRVNVYPFEHGLSPVTAKLCDLLSRGKVGDVLTDEMMTLHCGRDTSVAGKGYANLQTAIQRTIRNHRLLWDRIRGTGCIKCLDDKGKVSFSEGSMDKMRRRSRRTKRVMGLVDLESLADKDRNEFLTKFAQVGTVELMLKPQTTAKMLARGLTKTPELGSLLESFIKVG